VDLNMQANCRLVVPPDHSATSNLNIAYMQVPLSASQRCSSS
jgi:hypothetical protein